MDFDEHLEALLKTVQVAWTNYEIWWLYRCDRPQYVEVMNRYLGFFSCSIHAHFLAMLMALFKLGDTRDDSASLRRLLLEARINPKIDAAVLAEAESKLDQLEPSFKKIRTLRNKVFAHLDLRLSYDEVFAQAGITGDELRDAIRNLLAILNGIVHSRQRTMWSLQAGAKSATRRMLDALKEAELKRKEIADAEPTMP